VFAITRAPEKARISRHSNGAVIAAAFQSETADKQAKKFEGLSDSSVKTALRYIHNVNFVSRQPNSVVDPLSELLEDLGLMVIKKLSTLD
jgi:hypothetical protein